MAIPDPTGGSESSDLTSRLHQRLIRDFAWDNDEQLRRAIDVVIAQDRQVFLNPEQHNALANELFDLVAGHGPIERFVRDPNVSEIMVNGPDRIWVQYRNEDAPRQVIGVSFRDEAEIRNVILRIVSRASNNASINQAEPLVDTRLPDGSRVHAAIPPVSLNGPILTIRKFITKPLTLDDLVEKKTLPPVVRGFLETCVRGRVSMLVSGGTNSGKTTTLNALSSHIPETERVVTIEDTAELRLNQRNLVRLEARPANAEGKGEITIRDLVRNSLRMRPDRIIVGECRGAEALDMLQAMNTGHDGSLTTIHANSIEDAMSRLETMVQMSGINLPVNAVRYQIRGALRLALQQRLYTRGIRRIVSVGVIPHRSPDGSENTPITPREIYRYDSSGDYWECVGSPNDLSDLYEDLKRHDPQFNQPLVQPGAKYPVSDQS